MEITDSPPLCLKALLQIKSRLAFQHVIDRPCQLMSQDGQCLALAVFVLEAGETFLRGRIIPQEEDGGFGKGPCEMGVADFGAGGA